MKTYSIEHPSALEFVMTSKTKHTRLTVMHILHWETWNYGLLKSRPICTTHEGTQQISPSSGHFARCSISATYLHHSLQKRNNPFRQHSTTTAQHQLYGRGLLPRQLKLWVICQYHATLKSSSHHYLDHWKLQTKKLSSSKFSFLPLSLHIADTFLLLTMRSSSAHIHSIATYPSQQMCAQVQIVSSCLIQQFQDE